MNTDQKQDHTAYHEPQAIQEPGAPPESLGPGQLAEPHAEQIPAYDPQDTGYTTNEHPHEKAHAHPATSIPLVAPPSHGGAARSYSHGSDDPADPGHYTRDPHKLIAYLIPFPKPSLKHVPAHDVPDRFLIYTPPPPPLTKPPEGEKEAKLHKVQRKWQEEVREAKMSDAKVASWKGLKSRATKGISWAINRTTSSSLDFLNRLGEEEKEASKQDQTKGKEGEAAGTDESGGADGAVDGTAEDGTTATGSGSGQAPGLNELVLVYPSTSQDSPEAMRTEFVNSMLRTKSKAQKDAVIATSLIPVAFAVDVLATLIWPFGGLAEIDGVWAYASFRGAKVARSTTKRLQADESGDEDGKSGSKSKKEKHLKLTFTPSARVQTLARYLAARCHERDPHMFPPAGGVPTETEVLEAIGWAPSQTGGVKRNWEEEQWEMSEVKDDFKQVMQKGAKEWEKWCKAFEKNPKKALKK
ncbi:hypothetical protein BD309DRAFT_973609 [Dichomitus squalens]|uniref:Uncharacterized protein n=1 Tax=Dichomitus squalens TaxID=114155 RepID=A0A4Q9NEL7_9APHY|nr:hypothetical protein BD309DRAFT_973609 [Dichomitus squalens]TBU57542.1 hypothetical protein BD310DRAFT_929263 [Dichomitus squalens]